MGLIHQTFIKKLLFRAQEMERQAQDDGLRVTLCRVQPRAEGFAHTDHHLCCPTRPSCMKTILLVSLRLSDYSGSFRVFVALLNLFGSLSMIPSQSSLCVYSPSCSHPPERVLTCHGPSASGGPPCAL